MVTNELENLAEKQTVKLNIPLVASYLARGVKRTKIAELCNISSQAVYDYCSRHYDKLAPLLDNNDNISAMKAKYVAEEAKDKLIDIFRTCNDFSKKDLIPLTAVSDRHTQQYRLLSDKSTSNVSIDAVNTNLDDVRSRKAAIEARLQAVTK